MPSWSSASASVDARAAGLLGRFVEASRRAEIVALVNEAGTADALARVAARELCEALDAELGFVLVASEDGTRELLARVGLRGEERGAVLRGDVVDAALAADRAQAHAGRDLLGLGARRLLVSPWDAGNGRRLLIGVGRLYDEPFPPGEVALLESVTTSVGHALERAFLGAERERQIARQAALARAAKALNASLVRDEVLATLAAEVQEALRADAVAVFFTHPVRGLEVVAGRGLPPDSIGERGALGDALSVQVVTRAAAVVVGDGEEEVQTGVRDLMGMRAGAAVPIRRHAEVDGVLLVGTRERRRVPDADVQLLAAFADLAGVAWRNADEHAAAQRAATLDPLTGCLNHGAFQARLREELARAERTGGPTALVLLDLNDFKAVNDRFGHLTGDALLRTVAEVVRGAVRAYDQVGRWGGDEFALLLPDTDEPTARRVVGRALGALGRAPLPGGSFASASAGLGLWRPGDTPTALVDRADRALLEAKQARRTGPAVARGAPAPVPDGEERRRLHRLVTVGALGTRLTRVLDQRGIAETAVAELSTTLGYERCLLARRAPDGRLSVVAAAHSAGGEPELEGTLSLEGAVRRCVDEERVVLVTDARRDPVYAGARAAGVASELAVPVHAGSELWGAIGLRSGEPAAFDEEDAQLVQGVADYVGAALRTAELYHALEQTYLGTAAALAAALEARDLYTADHARSIAELAVAVGRRLGLADGDVHDLRYGAIFHDIGKIAVPDAILTKPAPLDAEELEVVRRHPLVGEQILAPVPFLSGVRRIVRHDHERWDGAGYPDGLRGQEIPLGARIVLVVDAFQAMTSDRPYRRALDADTARAELLTGAGSQFDAQVVEALLAELDAGALTPVPAQPIM